MILGLTGSYGSGKSTVADMMRSLGGVVIDADQIARDVVQPDQPALEAIRRAFGDDVLHSDGTLNRKEIARLVFSDPEKRSLLESIVHPRVRERELALLQQYADHPLVVLNVPLLFENHMEPLCDATCVVVVQENERKKRLEQRDHATDEEIRKRLRSQMDQEEKKRRADYVIENSGTLENTQTQVETIVRILLKK